MRRASSVLAVIAIFASGLAYSAAPADATTASLTITTLGRHGTAVSTPAGTAGSMIVASKVHTVGVHYLTGGRAASLSAGTYDVVADIYDPADQSDTLAARRVTVSGKTKITLDARQGRLIQAGLSPAAPAGYAQRFQMALCADDSGAGVTAWTYGNALYAIPSSVPGIEFAYSSTWTPANGGAGPLFMAFARYGHGLPDGAHRTFKQSDLSTITVHARGGPETELAGVTLRGETDYACFDGVLNISASMGLPSSFTAHVPPAQWSVEERGYDRDELFQSGWLVTRPGHTYDETLNAAAWGPSSVLPYVTLDRRLEVPTQMFTDSVMSSGSVGADETVRLYRGSAQIAKRAVAQGDPSVRLALPSRGWYTLIVQASRPPSPFGDDLLSSAATLRMHFYADPHQPGYVRGYVTTFQPGRLNSRNEAAVSTTTLVRLGLKRKRLDPDIRLPRDSIKRVRVAASADGGKTWHTVVVTHSHGIWTAHVRDATAGYVSLRSTVIDSHGNSTTTTVIRAYAVR